MTLEERADRLLSDLEVCQPQASNSVVLMHLSNVAVEMKELCYKTASDRLSSLPIAAEVVAAIMALEYSEKVDRVPREG